MQTGIEISLATNIAAAAFSVAVGVFLLGRWKKQENRLLTDLPLMFGITFITQAISQMMLALPNLGLVEDTSLYFGVRSVVILGTTLPLLGATLNIWLARFQQYHMRILGLLALYWLSAVVLGPSREVIILLHTPILIGLMIALMVTFAITWKTGRLKEVRSELILASLLLTIVSQVTRVSFMTAGLDALSNLLNTAAVILAALALTNPWYWRKYRATKVIALETELCA